MERKKYIESSTNYFKSKDLQDKYTITNRLVLFIPAITIDCYPPYIAGEKDRKWIKYRGKLDVYDKELCEKLIGMSLLPIE